MNNDDNFKSREDEFGFCKGCGYIPEKCECGNTFVGNGEGE